ncbi:MAG TPA: NAD(P)/FAD-dependent oxidoreductase [Gammaproteobacteria bacterium]
MEPEFDVVVVGAGVVGLAVARALALAGQEVLIVEKNAAIGEETSSRNSEVIHAGIYYPRGSLKAELCVRGRDALYRYCAEKGIPHRRIGKVIVAVSDEQRADLERLRLAGRANGVGDLEWLDRDGLHALEPEVSGVAALLSPSTGIIDSHALMLALQGDLEQAGGQVALRSRLRDGTSAGNGLELRVETDDGIVELRARAVVNAAGLHADRVARALPELATAAIPTLRYAKGNYFVYGGTSPFRHLVYPLPEPGGLGVHATIDLAGRTRFGPDVEWTDAIDYSLDASRVERFYSAIRRYWPGLRDGTLSPGYVGIRPKLTGPGAPAADFMIVFGAAPGGGRIAHLFGIESPGLTSCLAIAEHVRDRLTG